MKDTALSELVEELIVPAKLFQDYTRDDGSTERSRAEFRKAAKEALTKAKQSGIAHALERVEKHEEMFECRSKKCACELLTDLSTSLRKDLEGNKES